MTWIKLFSGYLLQIVPSATLCFCPFANKYRFNKKKTIYFLTTLITIMGIVFASIGTHSLSCNIATQSRYNYLNIIFGISLLCSFIAYLVTIKENWPSKTFIFIFVITSALGITSMCNLALMHMPKTDTTGLPYQDATIPVILICTLLFFPGLVSLLRNYYVPVSEWLTKKEQIYLIIAAICLFSILFSGWSIIGYVGTYSYSTIGLYVGLLLSIFTIYIIYFRFMRLTHEHRIIQEDLLRVEHQLQINYTQHKYLMSAIENSQKIKHDTKHHVITLSGFLNEGKYQEAQNYLKKYADSLNELEIGKICDNQTVNTIVSYYHAQANALGITFHCKVSIPPELTMPATDISVLLGNLLENAITAASQTTENKPFVALNIITSGDMVAITLDNSFSNILSTDNHEYLSTKENHTGIGLHSIQDIAQKYNGTALFNHEENVFHASVMLCNLASAK